VTDGNYEGLKIEINAPLRRIEISGLEFNFENGMIYVGRTYDNEGRVAKEGIAMTPYRFFTEVLFSNLVVLLADINYINYYIRTNPNFSLGYKPYLNSQNNYNFEKMFANLVYMTDLMDDEWHSAFWHIMRTFDAQRVVADQGQWFTLFFGQGAGAFDFEINLKATLLKTQAPANWLQNNIFPFDIDTGRSNYRDDDGFVFARDMDVSPVMHASVVEDRIARIGVDYVRDGQPYRFYWDSPVVWHIALTGDLMDNTRAGGRLINYNDARGINNDLFAIDPRFRDGEGNPIFYEGMALEMISWEEMMLGGTYIWVTAMLHDGTRLYRRLNIIGVNLEHGFRISAGDSSVFNRAGDTIITPTAFGATITVNNIYEMYLLLNTAYHEAGMGEGMRNTFEFITTQNLPTFITLVDEHGVLREELIIRDWQLVMTPTQLRTIRWDTGTTLIPDTLFARARVFGTWIHLYLDVKINAVEAFSFTGGSLTSQHSFDTVLWDEEPDGAGGTRKTLAVFIAPYQHTAYAGTFVFPSQINLSFNGLALTHANLNTVFIELLIGGTRGNPMTSVRYDHLGVPYQNSTVRAVVTLPDGQEVYVDFVFVIQEINIEANRGFFVFSGYNVGDETNNERNTYNADPYNIDTYHVSDPLSKHSRHIPTSVNVFFNLVIAGQTYTYDSLTHTFDIDGMLNLGLGAGQDFNFGTYRTPISSLGWQAQPFNNTSVSLVNMLRYDAYQVHLQSPDAFFTLTTNFNLANLPPTAPSFMQGLRLNLFVMDRRFVDWTMQGQQGLMTDYLVPEPSSPFSRTFPRALWHFDDPFVNRASDMPADISGLVLDESHRRNYNIAWQFSDARIEAGGTTNESDGFVLVTGHVRGDASYGQPITMRIYIDRWEFSAIRTRVVADNGNVQWNIMTGESLRFSFERDTGLCNELEYRIGFNITSYNIGADGFVMSRQTTAATKQFSTRFGQGISCLNHSACAGNACVSTSGCGDCRGSGSCNNNYFIEFSSSALNEAQQPQSNNRGTGFYYLVNGQRNADGTHRRIIYPGQTATYQYEFMSIETFDLGYGILGNNPEVGRRNVLYVVNPFDIRFEDAGFTVPVRGRRHNNTHLTDFGNASIDWRREHLTNTQANAGYIAPFLKGEVLIHTIRLTINYPFFVLDQMFEITILFLDMSPSPANTPLNVSEIVVIPRDIYRTCMCIDTVNHPSCADSYRGFVNPYRGLYNSNIMVFDPLANGGAGGYVHDFFFNALNRGIQKINLQHNVNKQPSDPDWESFRYTAYIIEWENTQFSPVVYSKQVRINGILYSTDMIMANRV
jgi:hypothetical protein